MTGFQSLLQSLESGLNDLTAGSSFGAMANKAKSTWAAQSPMTKGAVAGGLLGLLLSGNARRMAGSVAEVGAAALIGGLAMKAYADWQASAAPAPQQAEDLPHRLLQAMIAAARADAVITPQEHAAIVAELASLGLGPQAEALIRDELAAPLGAEGIAALARSPEEAATLYAASVLVVAQRGAAEEAYLAALARTLSLDPALVRHLEANVPLQA